jgi:hypothetical protein
MKRVLLISIVLLSSLRTFAQVDEGQLGAWYMYFWNTSFGDSKFGMQGDIQHRNWNVAGDLEQLLIRGGFTYKPNQSNIKLTLGYGNITSGQFGGSDATSKEHRIYQEALIPLNIDKKVFIVNRLRYEQRFVENQDFRTRYRYNLFVNIPLNGKSMGEGSVYLALYNELFLNGERNIGDNRKVKIFDRNRTYGALGFGLSKNLKLQVGYMHQATSGVKKGQAQFSLHHNF